MLTRRNLSRRAGLLSAAALAFGIVATSGDSAPAAAMTPQSGTMSETVSAGQDATPSVNRSARERGFGRNGGDG